jgi:hypothetical protein
MTITFWDNTYVLSLLSGCSLVCQLLDFPRRSRTPPPRRSSREHSKSWGAGEVRLGSGLTGKVGLVAKLVWRVKLVAELRPGVLTETEVARIERDEQAGLADLGLRLAETKRLTAALQAEIVPAQVAAVGEQRRSCSSCGRRLASKGHYPVTFRSLFGDVPVRIRRLLVCPCQEAVEVKSVCTLDLATGCGFL